MVVRGRQDVINMGEHGIRRRWRRGKHQQRVRLVAEKLAKMETVAAEKEPNSAETDNESEVERNSRAEVNV